MKTTACFLILIFTGLNLFAQTPRQIPSRRNLAGTNNPTASPAANPAFPAAPAVPEAGTAEGNLPDANAAVGATAPPEEMVPAGTIDFEGVDVSQVLLVYAKLVGRTLLRSGLPAASIVLKTETPLTKAEAIQALQAVLSLNGISVINIGDKFVKVLPIDQANTAGAEFNDASAAKLPDLGTYVTHIVQLKNIKPTEMAPIIQPFAKLPNSILPIDSNQILVLRDNAENVKRMLQMIERVDVSVPAEYISEVIPIKYALAEDIASALNSLGGSGSGSTVSFGGSTTGATTGGTRSTGGLNNNNLGGNGIGGGYQNGGGIGGGQRNFGGTTPVGGAPTGGATSFQQRLQSIIQRASGSGQPDAIQVFGQTKIIADQRSNSLLIFATRQDMVSIKNVVSKLDVLLSQVLIESVIMEVAMGHQWNVGVSAVQRPQAFRGSITNTFVGTGGYNNGQNFFDFINRAVGGATNSDIPGGLSYFGSIAGSDYDVAVQAAESDDTTTIIQKPRIQTFQAQAASFFVGNTVPYVTSTYNGIGSGGSGSSYSQLSVGVSLDVTPFINPDGLVVMQIQEEIDNLNGSTFIQGVGDVPNTTKKTLTSNVAVKDRDSIILGGAISSQKTANKSGVPILQDIPLLGALFSSRSSNKTRDELLVLMRPTVLKTPELAALQAKKEESRLPGIAHLEAQDNKEELKQVRAEEKLQQIQDAKDAKAAARAAAKSGNNGALQSPVVTPAPDVPAMDAQPTTVPSGN